MSNHDLQRAAEQLKKEFGGDKEHSIKQVGVGTNRMAAGFKGMVMPEVSERMAEGFGSRQHVPDFTTDEPDVMRMFAETEALTVQTVSGVPSGWIVEREKSMSERTFELLGSNPRTKRRDRSGNEISDAMVVGRPHYDEVTVRSRFQIPSEMTIADSKGRPLERIPFSLSHQEANAVKFKRADETSDPNVYLFDANKLPVYMASEMVLVPNEEDIKPFVYENIVKQKDAVCFSHFAQIMVRQAKKMQRAIRSLRAQIQKNHRVDIMYLFYEFAYQNKWRFEDVVAATSTKAKGPCFFILD